MTINYLNGSQELLQDNSVGGGSIFGDGLKWQNSLGVEAKYIFSDAASLKLNYKYDLSSSDKILSQEFLYKINKTALLTTGLEILESPEDSSFWSSFRSNDTLYSNLSITF